MGRIVTDLTLHLDSIAAAATALAAAAIPEHQLVDVAGDLRHAERRLADLRRNLESEIPPGAVGEKYKAVERRSAKRSYNSEALVRLFRDRWEAPSDSDALYELWRAGVIDVAWRWTDLQRAADKWDVTLGVAKHEIRDGDDSVHVGEVWRTVTTIEGVTE